MPHLKMVSNPTMFKILGIWFTQDLKECAAINYNTNFDNKNVTAFNVKFTQNLVLFQTQIVIRTDTVFDLVILQAKQFIYKCKLDKCFSNLSCFLQ